MPFVDLLSSDDFVSIYYMTNSQFGNVGGFDPDKPTILILHPPFFDTQWLNYHWGDPRLYNNFNLIAFDMRCSGRTLSRPSARHDAWVEAADVAQCHMKLRLPPCHILALETTSVCVALRLAFLFPELCLSLALCNVPSPTEPDWAFGVLDEMMKRWCFARDMETFEHGGVEAVNLLCGYDNDPELYDEVIAYLASKTPRHQRIRVAELFGVYVNVESTSWPLFASESNLLRNFPSVPLQRTSLSRDQLAEIAHPTIIFHGERNDLHSMEYADNLHASLAGVEGGAAICPIMCGASNVSLNRDAAFMLNNLYSKFLRQRFTNSRSELRTEDISIRDRMERALFSLANIMDRPQMTSGDPLSSTSFSCLSEVGIQRQADLLREYGEGSGHSFSPLGPDGRPLRKYSDRDGRHWFESGPSGLSIADADFIPPQNRMRPGKEQKTGRRNTLQNVELSLSLPSSNTPSIDQMKTSLAKVVANPANTLGRAIIPT